MTISVLACAPCGLSDFLERAGAIPDEAVISEVEEIIETAQEAAEAGAEGDGNQEARHADEEQEPALANV